MGLRRAHRKIAAAKSAKSHKASRKAAPSARAPAKASHSKKPSVDAPPVEVAPKKKPEEAPPQDKYSQWAVEAISVLATKDHGFVPFEKIKRYLGDYMANEKLVVIPKLTKRALMALIEGKWVIAKKESYALSQKGKAKMAPKSIGKRKKVERAKPLPFDIGAIMVPKILINSTGRISKETVL
jgi:hypothetical protein